MRQFLENGRLALRLVQDPRVPVWLKVGVPLLVVLYVLSPLDIIPDFLVGPGELDDLGVVLLGLSLMIRLAPQQVVEEHRQALGYEPVGSGGYTPNSDPQAGQTRRVDPTIDGEYRVITPDDVPDNRTRKL